MKVVKWVSLIVIVILAGALLLAALHPSSGGHGPDAAQQVGKQASTRAQLKNKAFTADSTPPPPSSADKNSRPVFYKGTHPSIASLRSMAEEAPVSERGQRVAEVKRVAKSAGENAGAQASLYFADYEPLRYNDGYVQHRPHVFVTFWGKGWNSEGSTKEKVLDMYRWVSGSNYQKILTQYFDHSGPIGTETDLTAYTDTREDPQKVTASDIRNEVAYSIEHQGWGTPSYENQYVVIMSPQATFTKGLTGFCGAHGWWGEGHSLSYTIAGWPSEGCYEAGATKPWQSLQETLSHEWAESATDPIPIAPYRGWTNSHWEPCEMKCGEIFELFYSYCAEYYCYTNEEVADECSSAEYSEQWLNKLYDDYLWKATGAYCVAHDESPVRYSAAVEQPVVSEASHNVEMRGSVNPAGYWSDYQFEFTRPGGEYSLVPAERKELPQETFSPVSLSGTAVALKGESTYHVKLNSTSELTYGIETGTSSQWGGEKTFTTPDWRPQVTIQPQTEVKAGKAILHGEIDPQGYPTEYSFEWGTVAGNKFDHSFPVPDASAGSGTNATSVSQTIEGLKGQTEYQYRLYAHNVEGSHTSAVQTFTAQDWRPVVVTELQNYVKAGHAILHGHINPTGFVTHYHFEWGTKAEFEAGKYGHSVPVPDTEIGSGESNVSVEQTIEGLKGATTYHYRLVAENEQGKTNGEDKYFTTPFWEPKLSGIDAINVESEEATLVARINPSGFPTTYRFEWATQSEAKEGKYGHVVPVPDEAIGSGEADIEKSVVLKGLKPRSTYDFRVFAQNEEGSLLYEGYEFTTGSGGFRATSYPAALNAKASTSFYLGLGSFGTFNCSAPSLEATLKEGKEPFENGAEILKTTTVGSFVCSSTFGSFKVEMNGCQFEFEPVYGESNSFATEVDIGPPGCGPIMLPDKPICQASIPSQTGGRATITNEGSGSSETMKISVEANHLRFTDEEGLCGSGSHGDGSLSGTWQVSGEHFYSAAGVYAVPFFNIGPEVSPEPAGEVARTTAVLHGAINTYGQASTWGFEYGKTTSYESGTITGESIPVGQKGSLKKQLSVSGLKPNTTYHFRMFAADESGKSQSQDETFTTASLAETGTASGVSATGATLHGTVYTLGLETSYQFEYGPTTAYGSKAPASPKTAGMASEVAVSEAITGLAAATTYHYRLLATNAEGTFYGADKTFATWGAWSTQSTPNPPVPPGPVGEARFEGVSCYSASMCVAVGENKQQGKAYAQWWNGSAWSASKSQEGFANGSRYGVACVSANVCQMVGTSSSGAAVVEEAFVFGNELLVGSTNKAANPEGASEVVLRDISCTSSSACTAVGYYTKEGKTKTLAERWNGSSWSIQTTPNPETGSASLLGVSCSSSSACWAVGKNEANVYAMSWNGTSWSASTLPKPSGATSAGLQKVSCPSSTSCTAVGQSFNGTIWKTLAESWNGSSWSVSTTPNPAGAVSGAFAGSYLTGLSCTSTSSCTAVGRYVTAVKSEIPSEEKTLVESWGGSEWQIQSSPNPEGKSLVRLSAVSCTSSIACRAVGWARKTEAEMVTLGEKYE